MLRRQRRRGNAALVFLITLPVLLLVLVLVLHTGQLEQARQHAQQAADASALAAAQTLVDDATLLRDPTAALVAVSAVVERSRAEAVRLHRANPVLGVVSDLDPNEENLAEGELVFGMIDSPGQGAPVVANLRLLEQLLLVNTVQVTVFRSRARGTSLPLLGGASLNGAASDIVRRSVAHIDRDVVGFRPVGETLIPLAPLALLSDKDDADSWEQQVEMAKGEDRYRSVRDPEYRVVADPKGDGLPEMVVHLQDLANGGGDTPANALLLKLGTTVASEIARQFAEGLRPGDLLEFGDELILGPEGRLPVSGSLFCPGPDTIDFAQLLVAINSLAVSGEPRAWPLFDPHGIAASGQPMLSGFVAARVMSVERVKTGLRIVLQPARLHSVTAATRTDVPEAGGTPAQNRYLGKVRLIN